MLPFARLRILFSYDGINPFYKDIMQFAEDIWAAWGLRENWMHSITNDPPYQISSSFFLLSHLPTLLYSFLNFEIVWSWCQ